MRIGLIDSPIRLNVWGTDPRDLVVVTGEALLEEGVGGVA